MVSLALSVKAVSTVKLVLVAIAVTVLVSPVTVILSPTTNSVVKRVLTPVTVVEAAGSMVPVRTEVAAPVVLVEPATSNFRRGPVVPMPTLPFGKLTLVIAVPVPLRTSSAFTPTEPALFRVLSLNTLFSGKKSHTRSSAP